MSRINTNVPALQAIGRLQRNQGDLLVRLERLSTGLRINRGKDDPAGLIASETLRSEINGIRQAIDNSQRAINVMSTAEGALNEVSSLLLNLQALVVEIANRGALTDPEIEADQLEIDSLLASIDRIANTSEFGGSRLLDGTKAYITTSADVNALASVSLYSARIPEGATRNIEVQVTQSAALAELAFTGTTTSQVTVELAGIYGSEIISFASGTTIADVVVAINDSKEVTGISAYVSGSNAVVLNSTIYGSDAFIRVKPIAGNFIEANAGDTLLDYGGNAEVLVNGQQAAVQGLRADLRTAGLDARFYLTPAFGTALSSTSFTITGGGAIFQLGSEVAPSAQISLGFESTSTANLGNSVVGFLRTLASGNENEVSRDKTIPAQRIIEEAINQVAKYRGRLGSVQRNQIETNINSQQIALENVTASESAIRDADYAVEVTALTRAQILTQATQQNLAFASQLPSQVLTLLGG